jgi:drug/metabolite transporter (DMT)-like permease
LDTIAAMTVNGLCFYAIAAVLRSRGTELMAGAAGLLFAVSPFAVLQPLAYLVRTNQYSFRFDWFYLALALTVTLLSERRQRKSFYYAGLLNTGAALFLIAEHRQWFDRPSWGITLVVLGLVALVVGFVLDRQLRTERARPRARS